MVSSYLALAIGLLGYVVYKIFNSGKRQKGLPPGPPTVPVLGNALVLPPRYAHLYFQEQARKFNSDICSFKVFDGTLIVLNSATATHDLFDKRSQSFDGRPPNWLTADYICRGQHILLARKKENQVLRKLWNKMLGNNVISNYVELQEAESCAVLYNIMQKPISFYEGETYVVVSRLWLLMCQRSRDEAVLLLAYLDNSAREACAYIRRSRSIRLLREGFLQD